MRGRCLLCCTCLALAALAAPAAVAAGMAPTPLGVVSASVGQSGQEVVWTVQTAGPLRPAALRRAHRSLCLLLERRSGAAWGELCLRGSGRRFGVTFSRPAAPAPVAVSASVRRLGPGGVSAAFVPTSVGIGYRSFRWQVSSAVRAAGCAPAGPVAGHCSALYPAHPVLARLHVPKLVGCVASGPRWVAQGPATGREVALTFDDGPWPDTPQFLSVLERYHVPATFFEIGRQIAEYGQGGAVERRMLADGDMIGDHTWSHPDVAAGGAFARRQIVMAAEAIRTATGGFSSCLFRAPYGAVSPALLSVVRSLGMTAIQWDVDPRDWSLPGVRAIYENVLTHVHPGAIVIQHDGGGDRSETLAALPVEIRALERRGYQFVTVTRLLGMKLVYR